MEKKLWKIARQCFFYWIYNLWRHVFLIFIPVKLLIPFFEYLREVYHIASAMGITVWIFPVTKQKLLYLRVEFQGMV